MWYVSYIHMQGYRVRRSFDNRTAAQEFIDINAMVCPLPGVKLISSEPKISTEYLMNTLTDDEWDLLKAKLTAARLAHAKIANELWTLCDGFLDDMPYPDRIAGSADGDPASMAISRADTKAAEVAASHDEARRELHQLTSW